jgi:streptomycin 6-kinase
LTTTPEEAELEAAALAVWRDTGASVQLLDADVGALLLRRVRPASPLPPGDEATAVAVAADLLPRLHLPANDDGFPSLAELYPYLSRTAVEDLNYERRTRGDPDRARPAEELLPAADEAAARLCATAETSVLLHGDFIDKNILLDGDRYISADPIPRTGDPASDVGFFAHYHPPAANIFERAARVARATGNSAVRAQTWAAVWTVLQVVSAWREDLDELQRIATSPRCIDLLHSGT